MTLRLLAGLVIAAALPLTAQVPVPLPQPPRPARPDSFELRVFRGTTKAEELKFQHDSIVGAKLTRIDSAEIREAAREFVKNGADTLAAVGNRFRLSADSVLVPTWVEPQHISWTDVRVVSRSGRWVAVHADGLAIR